MHAMPDRDLPASLPLSDVEVLVRAQSGDSSAQATLPSRFGGIEPIAGVENGGGLLAAYANKVCRMNGMPPRDDIIQEIVAEVYVDMLRSEVSRFDPERGAPKAYLWGLAMNAARRVRRFEYPHRHCSSQGQEKAIADTPRTESPPVVSHDDIPELVDRSVESPPQLAIANEGQEIRSRSLSAFVARASQDVQTTIERRYWNGEPIAKVASDIGIERTTLSRRVKRHLDSGRRELAHLMVA